CMIINATFAQNGSDNHGIKTPICDSKSRLTAPNVGLNNAANIKIDTKAGTAHGKISTVRIVRLNLIRLSFTSTDRKSTRLNSSHVSISYAVFCLKKKKKKDED